MNAGAIPLVKEVILRSAAAAVSGDAAATGDNKLV